MDKITRLLYETKKLIILRYSDFASEIANANIEFRSDLKYKTAATDGKNIYIDPDYFESLSQEYRISLIVHELMHIKFKHMYRLEDKNGNKRDPDIWNEATDAIINANILRDGFKLKEGYVNIPNALKYNAEKLYEKLLKEKKENDKDYNNKGENKPFDDHSLWEEAFEKKNNETTDNKSYEEIDESKEFEENRKKRRARAEEILKRKKEELLKNNQENISSDEINLGNVGDENNSIDWKLLVRRLLEKDEILWSKRRSIRENNYAYRLEESFIEDEAETEVMIDVSGSVDLDMVKAFLRMLKPLLKDSKLKVGCFNTKFFDFVTITTNRDIDNFTIPSGARGSAANGTNLDLPVRSFTKKMEINKFIFTDGYPSFGYMPKEDLKNVDVIWLVYGNMDFKPCCGKVINITKEQLKYMQSCIDEDIKRKL